MRLSLPLILLGVTVVMGMATMVLVDAQIESGNKLILQEEKKEEPQLIKKVAVFYPKQALIEGIEGTVHLNVTIAKEGYVSVISVNKSDNDILNEAAMNAVSKYEFKPMKSECKVIIPVKFKLTPDEPDKN